ncbi:MAG: proton-conducting transporter membrane subunit, partial [Candidatus Omnitrophica bacterium]|nr:proton-conducting transporter membrane subunit [Candidatus Omnitrophota bacterium]
SVAKQFYAYLLITLSFINGALLSGNLLLLFFFWEGLLITILAMIMIGGKQSFKTATKAFIIVGVSDLCMMIGIALTGYLAGTLDISEIHLSMNWLSVLAFALIVIGAISKAGSMPFHSWIPDAALDAPLPFMALIPAALEKLLGIYFLTRVCLDMFRLIPGSNLSIFIMAIGAITIIFAVMLALVQKDYKKLLSYHAISQVGYMILGIGTCLPIGIIGGLFHMLNNALYKCCLFFTAGSVEKQSGTTNLEKLGGLASKMPVTFACFFVAALSISGVPPFNGFFSKELIYDAALERGMVFYLAALVGGFLTAASFLKLGHAVYFGKASDQNKNVKEAPWQMLAPMIIIAALCIIFGIYNSLPINSFIQSVSIEKLGSHSFTGFQANIKLVLISLAVLILAVVHHLIAARKNGGGLKAAEHIHHAPVLSNIYVAAENKITDPYEIGLKITNKVTKFFWFVDRAVDWIYNRFAVGLAYVCSMAIKALHTGSYSVYLSWSLAGMLLVILFLLSAH